MGEAARRAAAAYDLAVTRERFMAAIADLGRDGRTAAADGAPPAARRVPTD